MRRLAVALIAVLCVGFRDPPETRYRQARALQRSGRLEDALRRARGGMFQYPSASAWHWRFRILTGEVLNNHGRHAQAAALLRDARGPAAAEWRARWLAYLADARFFLGRDRAQKAAARAALDEAYRLAAASRDASLIAEVELRRAAAQEEPRVIEACYRNALRHASDAGDLFLVATAYAGMGYARLRWGRYDEATPWLEAARIAAEKDGARRLLANVLGNLGVCYFRLGDFERANTFLDRAAATAEEMEDTRNLQFWLGNLGEMSDRRGDTRRALDYLERARRAALASGDTAWEAALLNALAETALRAGEQRGAASYNGRSLALRRQLGDPRATLYSELTAARLARARGDPEAVAALRAVLASAEQLDEPRARWETHAELAALVGPEAERHYRAALAVIEAEWHRLYQDESKFTFLADLIRFYQDFVEFLAARGRAEEALQVSDGARARVMAGQLGLDPSRDPLPLAALRASGAIYLVYWLAPRRSFLWMVNGAGLRQFELPPEPEIAHLVEEYRGVLMRRHDPLERPYPVRARLWEAVAAQVAPHIPPGARVVLVPDGRLHELSFDTLIADERRYWLQDVRLAVAPSLHLLAFDPPSRRRASLLFIGDPRPPAGEFPPLQHLKEERAIVERTFPAHRVLAGDEAHPAAYFQAQPARFSAIHFAAHAVPNEASPLHSAVILSPHGEQYKLYAKDVLSAPLRADLVVVSACRGAGARTYSGEGLMGFARAFLQAGARNVVAGLWDVDDAATTLFMRHFYREIAGGAHPADALRAAKLALLDSPGPYRRPYFWAPFQTFTRHPVQ